MPQYHPPGKFDFCKPAEWKAWCSKFLAFRKLSKLEAEPVDMQVCSLKYVMGMPESVNIFETFENTLPPVYTFEHVLAKYNAYFQPRKNLVHLRAQFDKRIQNADESVEQYVRALHPLAKDCEFADHEERIRDRLVVGLSNEVLQDKLQMETDLTLAKAVVIARYYEQIMKQKQERQQQANVDAAQHKKSNAPKFATSKPSSVCKYCGRHGWHKDKRECPAFGKKCRTCGILNHFSQVCKQRTKSKLRNVEAYESQDTFLGSVESDVSGLWQLTAELNGCEVLFKIDTGADVDVIDECTFHNLNPKPSLQASDRALTSPGGSIDCIGCFRGMIDYRNKSITSTIYVICNKASGNLMGRRTASRMGVVNFVRSIDQSVFGDIGSWKTEPVKIHLRDGATPWSVHSARRIPIPLMDPVRRELQRMERFGVITPVSKPTEWCAPIVPVIKKVVSGRVTDVRICVDLKHLNQQVKRERYQLPVFAELTFKLAGAKVFSKLDAASGFWQIPLDEDSKLLTTFITPFGRYYFNRLCFGINLAPELYQRKMSELLRGINNVIVYMDDVLCFGETVDGHDIVLNQVLNRLKTAGIKLNKSKCEFHRPVIKFLGYELGSKGVSVDKDKIAAVMNMPPVERLRRIETVFRHGKLPTSTSSQLIGSCSTIKCIAAEGCMLVLGRRATESF
ncbi:Uncharacterised protein r2_g276 [Pycnogonum litorale]